MACDMGMTSAKTEKQPDNDVAAQLKQMNEKLDQISSDLAAIKISQPAVTPKQEVVIVKQESVVNDDVSLDEERAKARAAYGMVEEMLAAAVAYNKRTGKIPNDLSQLGGDYKLDGFRADINYNGPSLFRVIYTPYPPGYRPMLGPRGERQGGRDVYRIHFIAPYSYHYNAYPDIRKICDSDYKDYFVNICGYLAGKDMSDAQKNIYGYFRLGLD